MTNHFRRVKRCGRETMELASQGHSMFITITRNHHILKYTVTGILAAEAARRTLLQVKSSVR